MGYTVNGGGSFRVQEGRDGEALAALKAHAAQVAEADGHYPWANDDVLAGAATVAEWWAEVLGGIAPDDDGTIHVESSDSWAEEYDQAAQAMGPYVEAGGSCEWEGEDGTLWRWYFTGTECAEQMGMVVYR